MINQRLTNISRLLLAGLLIFELLNLADLLHYQLDFTWFGLIITLLFVWVSIEIVSSYFKKHTNHPVAGLAFLIAALAIYLDALGDILHLYSKIAWYDQLGHLAGGAAAGGIVLSLIINLQKSDKIKIGHFALGFFSLTTAAFLGVLYELEEYFEDFFTGSHRLGNGPDTANDLFLDILGALFIILLAIIYNKVKNRPSHFSSRQSSALDK